MNTKIKVDPRTFKIINQHQPIVHSPAQSTNPSETINSNTFTSDSDSSTSVDSEVDVKVIKLDTSEQIGGKETQLAVLPQTSAVSVKQIFTNQEKPKLENNTNKDNNLYNYLSINNNTENAKDQKDQNISKLDSLEESSNSVTSTQIEKQSEEKNSEQLEEPKEKQIEQSQQEDTTQDVFDLTQNKLYQVLSKLFESTKGDGIGENLDKMSKLFEKHNQIMEKILNQLIIMNTTYKQVKVPDIIQTSTKKAGNIIDFRKNIEKFEKR
jgi:hypothetical protein